MKFRRIGPDAAYLFPTEHLGRCLGPTRNKGNVMSQYVFLENGKVISIQTLRSLTEAKINSPLLKGSDEPCVLKIKLSLLHAVVDFLIMFLYFIFLYSFHD